MQGLLRDNRHRMGFGQLANRGNVQHLNGLADHHYCTHLRRVAMWKDPEKAPMKLQLSNVIPGSGGTYLDAIAKRETLRNKLRLAVAILKWQK